MQSGKIPRAPTETEKAELAGYIYLAAAWRAMIPSDEIQRIAEKMVEEAYIAVFGHVATDNPAVSRKVMVVVYDSPETTQVYTWDADGTIEKVSLAPAAG